jgi:meiotically up-regulated gene 157 (Mug157) protein
MLFHAILTMESADPLSYDIDIISNYLKMGANFNRPIISRKYNDCILKMDIFTYICGHGTKEMVNLFIQYGANVNCILPCTDVNNVSYKYYPITYSINKLNKDTTEALINAGANIPVSYKALHYVVKKKSYDITKLLLDNDIKIDESVMQLVETNYDNTIIKKLITDAVQVQSRKRLREPSPEVIQNHLSITTQKRCR